MEGKPNLKIRSLSEFDYRGQTVIFRPDLNSPLDPKTKRIVNTSRIEKTVPTLKYLLARGAKVAIIAHQGDTLDYHNLIPEAEHAEKLSFLLGRTIRYVDDVCGPAAQEAVRTLKPGDAVLLGNLRYLCEEISTFESVVKLTPAEMFDTWLVRNLAPLADLYVNDAFAAAHRNSPSMVAFQELLPTAGGLQLLDEYTALKSVLDNPVRPCVYVLGGAKISDAFGMMRKVLEDGAADKILTAGVTGLVMLIAEGIDVGAATNRFLKDRSFDEFIPEARDLLLRFGSKYVVPVDLAYERNGRRAELPVTSLPNDTAIFPDVGEKTILLFKDHIRQAGSVFVNGPVGMYENPLWEAGTREIWSAVAEATGYTVIGGGDSISAAAKFADTDKFNYLCTGGGAMVRFLAGKKLPLIEAMERAYKRNLRVPVRRR
jgi:phosphoglycerate kinase